MIWEEAACAGGRENPELFFPQGDGRKIGPKIARAKAVCARCPLREECLAWALKHHDLTREHGIWGGKTPHERRILIREYRRWAA